MVLQFRSSRRAMIAGVAAVALTPALGRALPTLAAGESVTTNERGTYLNPDMVHNVEITFEQADYDAMVVAFMQTGDKAWIEATVSIDEAVYPQSGVRLKGNSSLMGIVAQFSEPGGTPIAVDPLSKSPETLPWLVRLGKFVDGQTHQGVERIVIRSNDTATALNEALALDLLDAARLNSQRAAYIALAINGSAPVLRLSIEEPDQPWLDTHFPTGGPLFKSEAGGDWTYRGDAPEEYVDHFDLEAGNSGDDAADFAYLTRFLDFANNADDESFIAEIGSRIDTAKFANYLAMMDLMQNFDDIDGPGNNSYLHFDAASSMATVVPWDMNLAFINMAKFLDEDVEGIPTGNLPLEASSDGGALSIQASLNGTPVAIEDDFVIPYRPGDDENGGTPTPGDPRNGGGPRPGADGHTLGSTMNPLVQRLSTDATFAAQHVDATTSLRAELFTGGLAETILGRWIALLSSEGAALIDAATIEAEADALRKVMTEE